jgi:7-cyano-7-deazaguanine synthase
MSGDNVPDADTPDEAVYLPGRNVLLLSKAMLWCHLRHVPALASAVLEGNPFPDATLHFFRAFQDAVNEAVGGAVTLLQPYANLSKATVLARGRDLPLECTFSCMRPRNGNHCGACNKCAERMRAFRDAGIPDPTTYNAPLAPGERGRG